MYNTSLFFIISLNNMFTRQILATEVKWNRVEFPDKEVERSISRVEMKKQINILAVDTLKALLSNAKSFILVQEICQEIIDSVLENADASKQIVAEIYEYKKEHSDKSIKEILEMIIFAHQDIEPDSPDLTVTDEDFSFAYEFTYDDCMFLDSKEIREMCQKLLFLGRSEKNFDECMEKYMEVRGRYEQLKKMGRSHDVSGFIASIAPAPQELLLILDDHVDDDLQKVIEYRYTKSKNILVMPFDEYTKAVELIGFSLPSVTKLGFLHHSGNALLDDKPQFTDVDILQKVGQSLPNVAVFCERGCGLQLENPERFQKLIRQTLKTITGDTKLTNDAFDQSLKTGSIRFAKGEHQQLLRETTLLLSHRDGMDLAGRLLRKLCENLFEGGLGRNVEQVATKYYVGGYHGSNTGAVPEPGAGDRSKKHPKAIRFFSARKAPMAGAGGSEKRIKLSFGE